MKQPNKDKQSLKKYLKAFLDKSLIETLSHFFRSYASNRSAEFRSDLGELIGKGIAFEIVDSYGGEGMGEEYWTVYKFTLDNEVCWIKFNGWYASYTGSEYSEFFFVEPKEVVVTRYIKV